VPFALRAVPLIDDPQPLPVPSVPHKVYTK
jgi:hypothetical protein